LLEPDFFPAHPAGLNVSGTRQPASGIIPPHSAVTSGADRRLLRGASGEKEHRQ
jgi:hypothetical protein